MRSAACYCTRVHLESWRMRRVSTFLVVVGASWFTFTNGLGGVATFTFNADPRNDPGFIITSNVRDARSGLDIFEGTGGNPGGYLAITRSANGQASQVLFPDIDSGLIVRSFSIECDLRRRRRVEWFLYCTARTQWGPR